MYDYQEIQVSGLPSRLVDLDTLPFQRLGRHRCGGRGETFSLTTKTISTAPTIIHCASYSLIFFYNYALTSAGWKVADDQATLSDLIRALLQTSDCCYTRPITFHAVLQQPSLFRMNHLRVGSMRTAITSPIVMLFRGFRQHPYPKTKPRTLSHIIP